MQKKILIGVGSRANYGSIKSFISAAHSHPGLKVKVVAYGTCILKKYGNVSAHIEELIGAKNLIRLNTHVEGDELVNMTKTVALTSIQVSGVLEEESPDYVLTVGDRYETLGLVSAAALQNIAIIHTMGGEVTGTIDENLRHAITKLSHIHFVASSDAEKRVLKMGEDPRHVFNVGCPRIDSIRELLKNESEFTENDLKILYGDGVGSDINVEKTFILALYHPVTTEYQKNKVYGQQLIQALVRLNHPTIYLWPNSDAGSEQLASAVRSSRENSLDLKIRFYKNLPTNVYYKLMKRTACLVGNSSSGLRDGAFIGTPVVNVGTRQRGRERGANVIDCDHFEQDIVNATLQQIGRSYDAQMIYGNGYAAQKMCDILNDLEVPSAQKTIAY